MNDQSNVKLTLLLLLAFVSFSCNKETEVIGSEEVLLSNNAKVDLQFNNVMDGVPIEIGQMNYTNAAGESFSVNLLKYYISHPTLISEDGSEVEMIDHSLIDIASPDSWIIEATEVPNAVYTTLRLNVGIEESHNHSGDQTGVLDPINGMLWTWNTGYIFFKHEGHFQHSNGSELALTYHYGTDQAYVTINIPLNMEVKGVDKLVNVVFDLNDLYSSPALIGFENNNMHQSTSANDIPWIADMKLNFGNSFSASVVE